MNSLRIMGPKQIKAEHLVAMAVHMEWLATVLSPSNIFTLFMKYFISSIANAKYKSQGDALCLSSWSCGMPVPVLHSFFFGKAGCLFTRHTAFDSPILLSFNKLKKRKGKRRKGKRNLDLFTLADRNHEQKRQFDLLMWEIRFPSEIYPMHSRTQVKKKKRRELWYHIEYVACRRNRIVHTIIIL